MKYESHILLRDYETNSYLCWDEVSLEAMLIDPAAPSTSLWDEIEKKGLKLKYIVTTHGHADHIGGNEFFREKSGAILAIHKDEADYLTNANKNLSSYAGMKIISPKADLILEDGDILSLGENNFTIIHTPGHTEGGICVFGNGLLFSGDSLFLEDVGRTDLPGGDYKKLTNSIQNVLFLLPEETVVLPGHGPSTTIGDEKVGNRYFGLAARL